MVKTIKLAASTREEKQKENRSLRRAGIIPAVLYGPKEKNINLKVKRQEVEKIFAHHDSSGLVDLSIDGSDPIKTIIKDQQVDTTKGVITHLDFYKVNMKHKIDVQVPLHFINESKAVKELGGMLIKNIETLEVKCLPSEMLDKIDIDLSLLNTFEDHIKVSDIKLPASFEIINHPEDVIVHVMEPKVVEEEVQPAAEEAKEEAKPAEEAKTQE